MGENGRDLMTRDRNGNFVKAKKYWLVQKNKFDSEAEFQNKMSAFINPYTAKGGCCNPPCSFSPVSFSRIFFSQNVSI